MEFERLELKHNEQVTAAHINQLDRAIARTHRLPGLRVRRRQYPWGTSHSFHGRGGSGGSSPIFQPNVTILDKDTAEVRWDGPRALINGVSPIIGDLEITAEDPETGVRPALTVTADSFSAIGECGIYFRVEVEPDNFTIIRITPIAAAPPPPTEKLVAHKLALFLRLRAGRITYNEDDDRELFSSQGFFAVQRRPGGNFAPLFWAKF